VVTKTTWKTAVRAISRLHFSSRFSFISTADQWLLDSKAYHCCRRLTCWTSCKFTWLPVTGSTTFSCLQKIPRLFQDFSWPHHSFPPRTLSIITQQWQTAVTYSIYTVWQYNPSPNVHHKLQRNCSVSNITEILHTSIYTWCSIHKRHVGT